MRNNRGETKNDEVTSTDWSVELRWKLLPGGRNAEPFEEEEETKEKPFYIDSLNVYPESTSNA